MSIREEQTGKFFIGTEDNNYNPTIDQETNNFEELLEEEQIKKEMWANKEIMPLGFKIMILPYERNPYISHINKAGLLTDGGSYINPETGEREEVREIIGCAQVLEVGPDVKNIKPGDEVIYFKERSKPLPFMDKGFYLIDEVSALAVINNSEILKERWKM
jgi:hypothetical protein